MKKMNKNLNANKIEKEIKIAFNKSDIKILAENENKKWYYSLCTSKPKMGQPLIIGVNWGAGKEDYLPQNIENLPSKTNWDEMGSLTRIKSYIEKKFSHIIDVNEINQTNYCFFRSEKENQLTKKDIELCEPIFEKFVSMIKPQIIFGFSSKLRKYLFSNKKIYYINKKIIPNDSRNIYIFKGFIKFGDWWTYINLLPHPNNWNRFKNQNKKLDQIWGFAKGTYPYDYQFTDFLNFLEKKNIFLDLIKDPMHEIEIKKQLSDFENSSYITNISLQRFYIEKKYFKEYSEYCKNQPTKFMK